MNETVAEMIAVDIAREQNVGMDEAKEMAMQMMPDIPDTMYVLTNDTKVNGAAAILNDDIRQEIAEKVGDFYMLPSSIHETLIIPKDAGMEFKELEQMVQEVNQTQVAPGERLSDHVYEYDAKEHELFRSDRAEERAKQKEEKRDNRHERVSVKEKLAEKKDAVIKMNAGKEHSAPEKKKEAAPVKNEPSVAYQAATILFADGSSTVVPEYQGEIRKIARLAKEKNAHITVYGFASSRTRDTDVATHKRINFNISLKRAESVAAALIRAGAPKKSVAVEALSDSMPLYQEVMPEGERLNRRAEIYVSY